MYIYLAGYLWACYRVEVLSFVNLYRNLPEPDLGMCTGTVRNLPELDLRICTGTFRTLTLLSAPEPSATSRDLT